MELQKSATLLEALLSSAVQTCQPALKLRRHALRVSSTTGPVEVSVDPFAVEQAFVNLLDNAAKYTPDGGHIELMSTRDGGAVVIMVTDSGVGLPADLLVANGDRFRQCEHSRELAIGRLGVGLTLALAVIEMHGGTLRATSCGKGLGSSFVVRLPAYLVS